MIVRGLSATGDWTWGNSLGNYLTGQAMVAQNIQTRLYEWVGDCFFNLLAGVDWSLFLASKDELALTIAVKGVILNTNFVTGVAAISVVLTTSRKITLQYKAASVFGNIVDQFEYTIPNTTG